MTYNVHHGAGNDGVVDLQRIVDVIKSEQPDIVALQELDRFWDRSHGVDQPAALAELLGMNMFFGANMVLALDEHADIDHEYGVATFTNFPASCTDHQLLPVSEGWEPRGVMIAYVEVPSIGQTAVLNTHLQSDFRGQPGEEASRQRRIQAASLAEIVRAIDEPVILLGDFNTEIDDGELDALLETGLQEIWPSVGVGSGHTYPTGNSGPGKRIDMIFVSHQLAGDSAAVVRSEKSAEASDHYPLVAEINFKIT